ncbi:hypothetical protein NFJ02_03g100520 [Pycnococcus provasolii]
MASSSSQIQTMSSLTSSLSLLHDYAASAYTSALTRLVELEHEHEETARSIAWLTASLAEDKDVFKTKVPPQLARAIVDYRTARRAQQDASTSSQTTRGPSETAFLQALADERVPPAPADDDGGDDGEHSQLSLETECAVVAVAYEELRWLLEDGIDWTTAKSAPRGSRARARAVSQLRRAVAARRELRDAHDAVVRRRAFERDGGNAAATAVSSSHEEKGERVLERRRQQEEDARYRERCERFLASRRTNDDDNRQQTSSASSAAAAAAAACEWLPHDVRRFAETHAPTSYDVLLKHVRVRCKSPADASRVATARHELRHRLFELGLVVGPAARGLAPPGGGGGGGGGAPPSPGNFAAQCRLAHAILCGECGVGAGGRGTTRTPLHITTTTS